jgi:pSer/pThr/pTyr-binding forkhead associated (FHA) protein
MTRRAARATRAAVAKARDLLGDGPIAQPRPRSPVIRAVVSLKDMVVSKLELAKDRVTIGRLPTNDIVLDNLALSRHHAEIVRKGGVLVLRDLASSNGLFVNGERVSEERTLRSGDVIAAGKFVVCITIDGVALAKRAVDEALAAAAQATADGVTTTQPRPALYDSSPDAPNGDPSPVPLTDRIPWQHADGPAAHLVVKRGEPRGVFALHQDTFVIGSHRSCELRLTGVLAPRRLCMIVRGQGGYSVLNVSARAEGVWKNGKPVAHRAWLADGDRLELEDQILARFQVAAPGPEERA